MEAIREQLEKPLVVGVVGFVVGAIFGLVVLGWWLWPVQWTDAPPSALSYDAKVQYMRMAIEAYGQNLDPARATARFESVGDDAEQALQDVNTDPQGLPPEVIQAFATVVGAADVLQPGVPAVTPPAAGETQPAPAEGETPVTPEESPSLLSRVLPVLCVIGLVIVAAAVYLFISRSRKPQQETFEPTPAMQAQEAARQAAWTDYSSSGAEPPVAQFMASYKIGDDLFDDSFSIDSPVGEFLGECGVGISDTIGAGEPKKVTAFEVWLFDKNDIQTVTKVIMSAGAFNDPASRQRLEAKGEPVLAEPGGETVLETQTLQMVARVVDMGYAAEGAMPPESFFDNLILELAVWAK